MNYASTWKWNEEKQDYEHTETKKFSKEELKGCFVQYQGGGYEGCIWEYNYCYIDSKGNFHDIGSSGSMGAKNIEQLLNRISEANEDFDVINLMEDFDENKIKELDKYVDENSIDGVFYVNKWFLEHLSKIEPESKFPGFTAICNWCNERHNVEFMEPTSPQGAGGIVTINTEFICEDCWGIYSCGYCGELWNKDMIKYDKDGYIVSGPEFMYKDLGDKNDGHCSYCLEIEGIQEYFDSFYGCGTENYECPNCGRDWKRSEMIFKKVNWDNLKVIKGIYKCENIPEESTMELPKLFRGKTRMGNFVCTECVPTSDSIEIEIAKSGQEEIKW